MEIVSLFNEAIWHQKGAAKKNGANKKKPTNSKWNHVATT